MAIELLKIPLRSFGQPIPVAPDTNAEVQKINELVAAVNAGLTTSNAIVGGDKYVQYLSSQTYGVPAGALTLDRLDASTILPGTEATVINPHPTPLTATAASAYYRATIVPAGTAGAVLVPAFTGSPDRLPITWVEVVDNSSFTPLLASEVNPGKGAYAGLGLRPLLIALVNSSGMGSTTVVTIPATQAPATGPTVTGFLPATAAEGASITLTGTGFTKVTAVLFNGTPASFQLVNATTLVAVVPVGATTGPVAVTNSAGTGTSTASFTVKATVAPPIPGDTVAPSVSFTVPTAGATLTPGQQVLLTATATDNVAVQGVTFTDGATGAVLGAGAKNGNTYTLPYTPTAAGALSLVATATDAAGNSQSATVNATVQGAQTVNQLPVASAGQDLTITMPTSSVVLIGSASDPDAGDTLTYLWRPIAGPSTPLGLPAATLNVVVSNLVAGTYQFGFQATDQKGGKSTEDFVVVTVLAATAPTPGGTYTPSGDESAIYSSATAMPTQINAKGVRSNTTQPLEFQNPTTLAWVTGTVTSTAGGNEFAATLTEVATGTYAAGTLKMRIVGFSTIYYNQVPVTVTATTGGGGTTPSQSFKLLAEGNSLTAPADSWVSKLAAARAGDTTFSIQNLATSGEAWAQINSDAERAQLVAAKATTGKTSVVGWEGINSILGGGLNGQLNYAAAKSFYDFCTANGMVSAAVIITGARLSGQTDDYHAVIWDFVQQYNAAQRTGFDSGDLGATVLVDLQSVPVFAGYDGPLNTTYFQDGLHYTQAGQEIVAKMMGRAADALRAGTKTIITWQPSDGGAITPQPMLLTLSPNATYDPATKHYDYTGPMDYSWVPLGVSTSYSSRTSGESWIECSPSLSDNADFVVGFNLAREFQGGFSMDAGIIALLDGDGISIYPLVAGNPIEAGKRTLVAGTKYRLWRRDFQDGRGFNVYLLELLPGATEWTGGPGEVYNFNSVGGTLYLQAKIHARPEAGLTNVTTFGLA